MQFLAPLFFAALAGLAIPVLLHLTQREKKQIIRFPSLMFVRRIPVSVGAPAKDPELAAADGANGGARDDHPCVRAAVARLQQRADGRRERT